jgi:hypothetical protein
VARLSVCAAGPQRTRPRVAQARGLSPGVRGLVLRPARGRAGVAGPLRCAQSAALARWRAPLTPSRFAGARPAASLLRFAPSLPHIRAARFPPRARSRCRAPGCGRKNPPLPLRQKPEIDKKHRGPEAAREAPSCSAAQFARSVDSMSHAGKGAPLSLRPLRGARWSRAALTRRAPGQL